MKSSNVSNATEIDIFFIIVFIFSSYQLFKGYA
jgi:hypothetical protein